MWTNLNHYFTLHSQMHCNKSLYKMPAVRLCLNFLSH